MSCYHLTSYVPHSTHLSRYAKQMHLFRIPGRCNGRSHRSLTAQPLGARLRGHLPSCLLHPFPPTGALCGISQDVLSSSLPVSYVVTDYSTHFFICQALFSGILKFLFSGEKYTGSGRRLIGPRHIPRFPAFGRAASAGPGHPWRHPSGHPRRSAPGNG